MFEGHFFEKSNKLELTQKSEILNAYMSVK